MNASQGQNALLPPEAPVQETQDEFVSGHTNRARLLTLRLIGWVFRPPYFPAELTWLMLALIASNGAVELLAQPAAYWIDPAISWTYTFLGTPLEWGLWSIGIYVSYMLLVGLALSVINAKPAFALWLTLGVYHFWDLTLSFRCGSIYFAPLETPANCSEVHTATLAIAGVLWGVFLLAAARLGMISWVATSEQEAASKSAWTRRLGLISMTWIVFLSALVVLAATTGPKPEWQPVQPAHVPPARTEASLVYDSKRSVAVLFGGAPGWTQTGGWESMGDIWEWNGRDWNQLKPSHSPLPRYAAAMAFDEKRGIAVLFGGSGHDQDHQSIIYGDTWEWNGKDWVEVSPSVSPPARENASIYFDPLRGAVVVYGGDYLEPDTATNIFLDDAWEWDGQEWRQITFDQSRRNSASAIVFDPIHQVPMLMDAEGLWLWQDALWIPANFNAGAPSRWSSQMVYNPASQQIVLFGGFKDTEVFNDTWSYNGQTWQQVITKVQPPRRHGHNLFYDPVRGSVLLFGGLDGGLFHGDMWELVQP